MNPLKISGLIIALLMLSGCYGHHPHGFRSSAATGALMGAIVGGTAGYIIGDNYSDRDNYRSGHRHGPRRDYYDRGYGYNRRGRY